MANIKLFTSLILLWPPTRWCCLVWSLRSYLGITRSRARRTTRTVCPASSYSSASLRMEGGSPRSCRYACSDMMISLILQFFILISQVFSRQAVQMDALISAFVDEIKQVSFYPAKISTYSDFNCWPLISEGGHVCRGRGWEYLQRQLFHRGRWWDKNKYMIIEV